MITAIDTHKMPALDDPWRRLPWTLAAALLAWMLLLFVFAKVLDQSAAPAPLLKPLEARIIEIPAAGGLQGNGSAAPAAPAAPKPIVKPTTKPIPRPHVITHPRKALPPPASPAKSPSDKTSEPAPSTSGESSESASPPGATSNSGGTEGSSTPDEGTGGGSGNGGGIGTDSGGARAIYAPMPSIPDDLREDVFQTQAVARFKVSYEGKTEVSLVTPTPNPRLNLVLLETLRQWRFFPATKNGVPIDADFEVRIPISVH
jgi:protein TonB